jgi:hypothetical protein
VLRGNTRRGHRENNNLAMKQLNNEIGNWSFVVIGQVVIGCYWMSLIINQFKSVASAKSVFQLFKLTLSRSEKK